jgi:hypothetical protein
MKKFFILLVPMLLLSACSSPPKQTKTPVQSEAVAREVKIPDWYMNVPRSDSSLYSTGTFSSRDLQLSQEGAIINAKAMLADRINSRVRSQTKLYQNQRGNSDGGTDRHELERATRNTVNDVDVAGYVVAKIETVQDRGVFRTYVMLEYSADQAASVIMDRIRTESTARSQTSDSARAFRELDADLTR